MQNRHVREYGLCWKKFYLLTPMAAGYHDIMLRKKFLWGDLQIFSQKGMERRRGSVKTWLFWLVWLYKCSNSIVNIFLQYLLDKKEERHGRNLSGDSSGCSSGHESVSSSLTSDTRSSSDSGTEADQVRCLPWPICRTESATSKCTLCYCFMCNCNSTHKEHFAHWPAVSFQINYLNWVCNTRDRNHFRVYLKIWIWQVC